MELSSPNISLAVVKEKAPAVENDFQGFAQSRCEAFLKSEKSAYKSIFDAEIYSSRLTVCAKMLENADIACFLRCFVICRPFGYMVEINR